MSLMEFCFAKIVNGFQHLTIFRNKLYHDIRVCSKYTFDYG